MRSKINTKSRRRKVATIAPQTIDHRAILARRLDMLADLELQHGHHRQAEHLAHKAAKLRAVA